MQEGRRGWRVRRRSSGLRPCVSAICLHKWRSKLWPASLIIYTNTVATPTLFTQKFGKNGLKKRIFRERERERDVMWMPCWARSVTLSRSLETLSPLFLPRSTLPAESHDTDLRRRKKTISSSSSSVVHVFFFLDAFLSIGLCPSLMLI